MKCTHFLENPFRAGLTKKKKALSEYVKECLFKANETKLERDVQCSDIYGEV